MFLQENKDIKDGVTTSSKEQTRSLVHVRSMVKSLPKVVRIEL
jgi:hypothetical protein